MKPRTHIQQEVAHLSKRLPRLTATQKAYAFRHCFKHYAIKRADGTNICTECGHSWKSDHDLADTLCGCTCPHCGMQLEALRTRKSVFSENEYFSIVTTSKQYQVIRFFFVKSRYKAGQAAEYSIYEVVQRWISPDGKTTTVARLRGMSMLYYDQWAEYSDMEVRKDFIDMGNGLRMSLARNKTSANRLDIIYDGGADLYNMRFYRKTFSKKTFECRTKDIETHEGIYCDMLEEMFTMVTGLYTRF